MINVFGRSIRVPSNLTRLVLFVTLSLLLMVLDRQGQHLEKIRAGLASLAYPIQAVATLPARIGTSVSGLFTDEQTLKKNNEALRNERMMLLAKLQQFEALKEENNRLRRMLGSAARVADRALAADLLEVSLEPFTRRIVIARGAKDGVKIGQPIIDSHGIMGQVTQVTATNSRATLITDPGHAIPVLVNRSGLRAIVFGTGEQDSLKVPYLTASADIRKGDLLVSSGMGGTFPPGYPVARVTKIVNDPNEAFLTITAKPSARLNNSKQVLLIWPGKKQLRKNQATSADAKSTATDQTRTQ
ncbi:MAG: rod shape-determining protein MreC [Gammaproteobacteria bacterium]|nr:MAG: rod shape-determining protein MreC [Gammaproteobacteria bacterium]